MTNWKYGISARTYFIVACVYNRIRRMKLFGVKSSHIFTMYLFNEYFLMQTAENGHVASQLHTTID